MAKKLANKAYEVGKDTPGVGHVIATGHVIAGNNDEAKAIALASTKNAVVSMVAAGGAACGPGAPACAAALAIGASHGWDGAESGIRGEKV